MELFPGLDEAMDPILFDRARLRKRRARAAADFPAHDFLRREASARLAESLAVVTHRFPRIIELGGGLGLTREGTDAFIQCDLAEAMLRPLPGLRVVADEECLPFAENSADAVVSALSLHWVNDLPGALKQIFHVLKPDGLFLAVLFGAGTLRELRQVFAEVESERYGGVQSAHCAVRRGARGGGAAAARRLRAAGRRQRDAHRRISRPAAAIV